MHNAAAALAPPTATHERWSTLLDVSLNAQQYLSGGLLEGRLPPNTASSFQAAAGGFALYSDSLQVATVVSPEQTRSGELIVIFGRHFHGGCAYACRFGHEADAVVPGTYEARRGALSCHAPSRPAATVATIFVSLNGQQYFNTGVNATWAAA